MRAHWIAGPPTSMGHHWICWSGVVMVVDISPALIYRRDPSAPPLIKTLGGLAYDLASHAGDISHHAALVTPESP